MAYKRVAEKLTSNTSWQHVPLEDLRNALTGNVDTNYIIRRSIEVQSQGVDYDRYSFYNQPTYNHYLPKIKEALGDKYKNKTLRVLSDGWNLVVMIEYDGLSIEDMIERKRRARKVLKSKRKQLINIQKDIDDILNLFGDLEENEE